MKNSLCILMIIGLILFGGSFILFVIRMVWIPPGVMGLMMDRAIIYQYLSMWVKTTTYIIFIAIIIYFLWWLIRKKKDN